MGLDLSWKHGTLSDDKITCLKNDYYREFALLEVYNQTDYNPYMLDNYKVIKNAGIERVEFWTFPRITEDPDSQVRAAVQYLKDNNIQVDGFYFDIEGPQNFYTSCADNQWFIGALLDTASELLGESKVGILTDKDQWNAITCGWTGASAHKLWWTWIDTDASMLNWYDFGGWTQHSVARKQYGLMQTLCGQLINSDFDPKYVE